MGIRQKLFGLDNQTTQSSKSFEVWQEADGSIQAYQNGNALVAGEVNSTGGISLSVGGSDVSNRIINADDTPILMIGGDHPYMQWWGTDGSDGMAALYNAAGIVPYVALNTDELSTTSPGGSTDSMSWAEVRALNGVEYVAHGHRHYQDNAAPNAGIKVRYIGAAATATFQVTGGNAVGVTAGGVDDFSFSLSVAGYDTIAELVAAIDALPNWTASYAAELTGNEKSANALVGSAINVKAITGLWPFGGSISIKYTGTAHNDVCVTNDGTKLRIFGSGAYMGEAALSNNLSTIVTTLNSIPGVVAALSGSTTTDNYVNGTETGTNIAQWSGPLWLTYTATALEAGLSSAYLQRINQEKCRDVATENHVTLRDFAQSGEQFYEAQAQSGTFNTYRGNTPFLPVAHWSQAATDRFVTHCALTSSSHNTAKAVALIDALSDSKGFGLNVLIHKVLADGSSGYQFQTTDAGHYDQTEESLLSLVSAARDYIAAGLIKQCTFAELPQSLARMQPRNYLFNPRFRNSGETLSTAHVVPGWAVSLTGIGAATISDGVLSMSVTSGSTLLPLYQKCMLPPGSYELTAEVEIDGYTSGSGVFGYVGSVVGVMDGITSGATTLSEQRQKGNGTVRFAFSIAVPATKPAYVTSTAEPWNLSTNKNIQINIDAKAALDNLDCSAGASNASAVRAHEAAAAINAAIKANANYPAEYHNAAKAANGKLIISSPYIASSYGSQLTVSAATSASALSTMFGSTSTHTGFTRTQGGSWMNGAVAVGFGISLANAATVRISRPRLRRVGVPIA